MRPEAEKSLQLGPYGDGGDPEGSVEPLVLEITDGKEEEGDFASVSIYFIFIVGQANAQGAHGQQPPPLCEYEKLRERNIKEIEEAMKEKMKEIEDAKQDMRDNAPVAVKRKVEVDVDGRRNRKKVEPVMQLRRSGRERENLLATWWRMKGGRRKGRGGKKV